MDYLEKYEDVLNAMFEYEWTLLSAEESVQTFKDRPQRLTAWTIEYHDGNGDVRHFVFNNRSDGHIFGFPYQVVWYLTPTSHISDYYKEHFFAAYMEGIPLGRPGFVYVNMVSVHHVPGSPTQEYRRLLGTPEGAVRLSQITPANVFDMAPVFLWFRVSLGEYDGPDRQGFEEDVKRRVEAMIESMNQYTNNRLTARITLSYCERIYLHDGSREHVWYYIQGERVFIEGRFSAYVFESHRGVFW